VLRLPGHTHISQQSHDNDMCPCDLFGFISRGLMSFDFAMRLVAAFACGVAIGLERQLRQRTAGLRTITLVTSGACLFVTLGMLTGNGVAGVTQIAAYVVSGVGFLGGGV